MKRIGVEGVDAPLIGDRERRVRQQPGEQQGALRRDEAGPAGRRTGVPVLRVRPRHTEAQCGEHAVAVVQSDQRVAATRVADRTEKLSVQHSARRLQAHHRAELVLPLSAQQGRGRNRHPKKRNSPIHLFFSCEMGKRKLAEKIDSLEEDANRRFLDLDEQLDKHKDKIKRLKAELAATQSELEELRERFIERLDNLEDELKELRKKAIVK